VSDTGREPASMEDVRRIAVIVNPVKFPDSRAEKEQVTALCREAGWSEPIWIETTAEDPGEGQTKDAIGQGATIVCPLGGDGTVRVVASVLAGTDTPLGLLPGGTGNLLARNLDLPITSLESALRVVLTGSDRRIDVGLVRLGDSDVVPAIGSGGSGEPSAGREEDEEVFLVMTGMGLDADVMAGTNETIKAKVGWAAYLLAGLRHLWGPRFMVDVTTDRGSKRQHSRTVIVGNCGRLQGGVELMPDARLDDGVLDAVVISPHGLSGWAAVASDIASRHHRGHRRLVRLTVKRIELRTERPVEAQIDGDPMGTKRSLRARIWPGALVVRVG